MSNVYTNQPGRATTVHVLDMRRHIVIVTGHKSELLLKTCSGITDGKTKQIMSGKHSERIKEKFENKGKIIKSLDGVSPNFYLLFTDLNSHEGSLMEDFFQ